VSLRHERRNEIALIADPAMLAEAGQYRRKAGYRA
jgi:hypothetical protein